MGLVRDFVSRRYGCPTETVARVVVLNAVAPVNVLLNDPNRFDWTIFNLGAALGYAGFDPAVGALNGVIIAVNGGMLGLSAQEVGELTTQRLYAIGAGATTLYVVETRGI